MLPEYDLKENEFCEFGVLLMKDKDCGLATDDSHLDICGLVTLLHGPPMALLIGDLWLRQGRVLDGEDK